MQKYYLLSLVIMSIAIPLRQVTQPTLELGAKKTLWHFLLYLWFWGQGVKYIYWRLSP